jgi:hypothetical protein
MARFLVGIYRQRLEHQPLEALPVLLRQHHARGVGGIGPRQPPSVQLEGTIEMLARLLGRTTHAGRQAAQHDEHVVNRAISERLIQLQDALHHRDHRRQVGDEVRTILAS